MFKRGGVISRSLHAPHGVNIKGKSKQVSSKLVRKFSWSSPKVRSAVSVGVLTHKPVILKEGYLYKPGFFRIGGRRRRWCVLRTYTQTEATIDIYADETKSRYKGSITLDRVACPILIVKNYDPKKKKAYKNCYLLLKTDGKKDFQFTTDSFRDLKEWTALIRQVIDNGHLFSGSVTDPTTIAEGMVNVKFNANCISILCPIKEIPIKTWRLDQITSFGQSGGMLMFESCTTCSDPGAARCSMNIIQEKPTTILNLMEKAIRNNPNTGEIHYERSILGDIYHCDHDCFQSKGMLAAFSEPNLFVRSASSSPVKRGRIHVEVHNLDRDLPDSTNSNDTDSGFPGTPKHADALSITSSIPSPVGSNKSNPSLYCKQLKDEVSFHSPKLSTHQAFRETQSMSDSVKHHYPSNALLDFSKYQRLNADRISRDRTARQLIYSAVTPAVSSQPNWDEDLIHYTTVHVDSCNSEIYPLSEEHNKVQCMEEGIYDIPNCEPNHWEVCGEDLFSPPASPIELHNIRPASIVSGRSFSASVQSGSINRSSPQYAYSLGSDRQDREDDYDELPPVPKHQRRPRPVVKEMVRLNQNGSNRQFRARLHSTGDVLDESARPKKLSLDITGIRQLGSMDYINQVGRNRSKSALVTPPSTDITEKLHKENEMLDKMLARSKNQSNDEKYYTTARPRFKPYYDYSEMEQEYDSLENLDDPVQTLPTSATIDKLITKVAADTVRGYAYKIQIPLTNTQYDVPRRRAPTPDLTCIRNDAPPKPLRR